MNNRELILAAAAVAQSSPQGWKRLVDALRGEMAKVADEMISSKPEHLQMNQGRARELRELVETLATCKEQAEKIAPAPKPQPQTRY